MKMAAGAVVNGIFIKALAEVVRGAVAACVGPRVDGSDRAAPGIESEQTVPEGADPDGADLARAAQHGVDRGDRGLEQAHRIVLDASARDRQRLAENLVPDTLDPGADGVIESRARRRGTDVEGDDHTGPDAIVE